MSAARRRCSCTVQKPCSRPSTKITGTRSPYSARSSGSASTSLVCHGTSSSAQIRAMSSRAAAHGWQPARTSKVTSCCTALVCHRPAFRSEQRLDGRRDRVGSDGGRITESPLPRTLSYQVRTGCSPGCAPRSVSASYASARARRPLARTVDTMRTREWLMPQPRWTPEPRDRSATARRRADGPAARMRRLSHPVAGPIERNA
jgi:hypothetical protein